MLLYKLCAWRLSLNQNDDEEIILLLVPSDFSNSGKKRCESVKYFATVPDSGKIWTTETLTGYPSVTPRHVLEIYMVFI